MCLRIVFWTGPPLRRMDGGILPYLSEVDGPQPRLWLSWGRLWPQLTLWSLGAKSAMRIDQHSVQCC